MRTPISLSKRGSSQKTHNHDETNNLHSVGFWEKRGNRKYHGDGDYRSGFNHKSWCSYEREDHCVRNDLGRPPGADESAPIITPVILTREREAGESNKQVALSMSQIKENETTKCDAAVPPPKSYQIASKSNALEAMVLPEQVMCSALKFLDESLLLGEDLSPFLLDQNNFFVVAVVGLQACGKSTIASLLADPSRAKDFLSSSMWVFRPETRDEILRGCHATSGVDAFITKDRVIILDLQPLLSPSVMDYVVTQERKAVLDYSNSTENLLEIESLQLLTFAMNVSHVLVIVQDYIFHPNIVRLLHTSQMLKPSYSAGGHGRDDISGSVYSGSEIQQYFPHVVFIHNRASPHHFMPKFVEDLQVLYQTALADSVLGIESQIGICSGTFSPPLGLTPSSNGANLNLFLIPDIHYQEKCINTLAECGKTSENLVCMWSTAASYLEHWS